MACFLIPMTEAVVTTIATKVMQSKEKEQDIKLGEKTVEKLHFSNKMKWLNNMLWGGSALLAFEHVWHGEVSPIFPFLTAAGDPETASVMLHEMSTVGVGMAVLVTAVWGGMVAVTRKVEVNRLAEHKE